MVMDSRANFLNMNNQSIGSAFPHEIARCKQLVEHYKELGGVGFFGRSMIELRIRDAEEAWASGDITRIISTYWDLKGCE